jgi:hypothetical protein
MRKQIEFQAELIGQPGITVERRDGVGIDFVKVYKDIIRVVCDGGSTYSTFITGCFNGFEAHSNNDLLMFQEITEMSGGQWFGMTYDSLRTMTMKESLISAFEDGKSHIKELHNIK